MKNKFLAFFPFNNSLVKKRNTTILVWSLLPVSIGVVVLSQSFSFPKKASISAAMPFTLMKIDEPEPTKLNCQLNNSPLKGLITKEANLFRMEQSEGVYTKVVNMSIEDSHGNLIALILSDVQNDEINSNLNTINYFGTEHEKGNDNFSIDIGTSVFSNSSSLIFEQKDGSSNISRNGWIKISSCQNNIISGYFQFEIEEGNSKNIIEGEFVNVLLQVE